MTSERCYTPPLQLLRIYVEALVKTFVELYFFVETYPKYCSEITNSRECEKSKPPCIWRDEIPQISAVTNCVQSVRATAPGSAADKASFSLGYTNPPEETDSIPYGAGPSTVKLQLEQLKSIGVVDVSRSSSIDNSGDITYVYDITFPADKIPRASNSTDQTAAVPQLQILNVKNDVNAQVQTLVQGSGSLSDVNLYKAADSRDSPCIVDEIHRDEQILALGIGEKKLGQLIDLDKAMQRCASGVNPDAIWNDERDCARVLFSADDEGGGYMTEEEFDRPGSTANSFCVWRSKDAAINADPPRFNVNPEQVIKFQWENNTYGGKSGVVRNANCSVPMIYQTTQLLKIFGLSTESLGTINQTMVAVDLNLALTQQLGSFTEQYNTCFEDVKTIIQLPQPDFVLVWQKIIFTTCQTVALWYAVAALFLAYRMQKLRFLSPTSIFKSILNTLGIVLLGSAIGFILGFVLGGFPAAILSSIYTAIPHNLPLANTISLGAVQGLLIIYFDYGRGIQYRPVNAS